MGLQERAGEHPSTSLWASAAATCLSHPGVKSFGICTIVDYDHAKLLKLNLLVTANVGDAMVVCCGVYVSVPFVPSPPLLGWVLHHVGLLLQSLLGFFQMW